MRSIRKAVVQNGQQVGYVGAAMSLNYPADHLGEGAEVTETPRQNASEKPPEKRPACMRRALDAHTSHGCFLRTLQR